jgi:hypothetical protein
MDAERGGTKLWNHATLQRHQIATTNSKVLVKASIPSHFSKRFFPQRAACTG